MLKRVILLCLMLAGVSVQVIAAGEAEPADKGTQTESRPAGKDSDARGEKKKAEKKAAGDDEEPECD